MRTKVWPSLWSKVLCGAGLAAALAAPAAAAVLTMEGLVPGTVFFPGESFSEAGHSLTILTSAGVVDTSAAFGPGMGLDLAGPKGNATQFFIGLNDGGLRLTASNGGAFKVSGFDFGFISPLTALFAPNEVPGAFVATYETPDGAVGAITWNFLGADNTGEFNFQSASVADLGALATGVRQVDFFACTFDGRGACKNPNSNFGQFALDNIQVSGLLPAPGSLALVALAMALGIGVRGRRLR